MPVFVLVQIKTKTAIRSNLRAGSQPENLQQRLDWSKVAKTLIKQCYFFFRLEEDLWKIPRENIIIQTEAKIGAGAFADVYVAKLIGDAAIRRVYANSPGLSKFHDCEVAVKVLPQFSTEADKDDLQKVRFL